MDPNPDGAGLNKFEQLGLWFVAACKSAWMPPYTFSFIEKNIKKYTMKVEVDPTYLSVTVTVSPRFWEFSIKKQKLYLAHELWHVFAFSLDRVAEEAIERVTGEDEENGARLDKAYLEESERMADHAAQLLLPVLPEWKGVQHV